MNFKYHAYYPIVDFIKIDFGATEIYNYINKINGIVESDVNGKCYSDWTICFYFIYTKSSEMLVNKKGNVIRSIKNRDYIIILPIPDDKEISWGIKRSKFPCNMTNNKNPNDKKNFIKLPVKYDNFSNMKNYVTYYAKMAIISLLNNGLIIEGKKIKFSENAIDDIQGTTILE